MSPLMEYLDMNIAKGHVLSFSNRIDLEQHFATVASILMHSSVLLYWRSHQCRRHNAVGVSG